MTNAMLTNEDTLLLNDEFHSRYDGNGRIATEVHLEESLPCSQAGCYHSHDIVTVFSVRIEVEDAVLRSVAFVSSGSDEVQIAPDASTITLAQDTHAVEPCARLKGVVRCVVMCELTRNSRLTEMQREAIERHSEICDLITRFNAS